MHRLADPVTFSNRAIGWLLAAIVALGAALRIHFLDSALWYDELVTLIDSVRMPFASLVTQFPSNNNHVFYSVLARASIMVFGDHPWSLRLPAAVFGVASLPMLYLLGTRVTSRLEAVWTATLLTVSYHAVWFSQNARGYTLLLFFALLTTYLLLIGLREDKRSAYVMYGVIAALSAYTHLTMVVFVVGQAAVVAAHILARGAWRIKVRDWRNPTLGFAIAGLCTVALYAPMLGDVHAFFGREPTGAAVATVGWAVAETWRGLQLGYAAGGAMVVGGVLILIGCWSYFSQSRLVLALFVVPGAVLFAAVTVLHRPTFPRFFFFLAGFALLILARGTVVVSHWAADRMSVNRESGRLRRMLPVAVLTGIASISALTVPAAYRYPKQDYEGALRYVEQIAGARDVIVVAGGGAAIPYRDFYGKPWQRMTNAADLEGLRRRHDTVWLVYTFRRYIEALEPEIMNDILAHCTIARTFPGTVADGNIVVTRCKAG